MGKTGSIFAGVLLSPYKHRASFVHSFPPMAKLIVAVLFVVAMVLLPRDAWGAFAAGAGALLAVALVSRVGLGHLLARLILVEPFVLCVAGLSLFQPNGFWIFLSMLTRSTLCLFCMVLLSATTRFSDILGALWRLRVPPLIVTTLALMYRYLFLIFEEAGRMHRARASRTFSQSRWFVWRRWATVVGHLFVRTSSRAERIYDAMCARGWRT